MKESYFTTESLELQAQDLYQQVAEITRIKPITFQPSRAALLVCDMQAYFLDPASHAYVPSAAAILDGIVQLIKLSSSFAIPVIFTQHINNSENAGMMSVWWKDLITAQNPFHRIIPEIDLSLGTLIQKGQYDAFHQTQLEKVLRDKGVSQVIICGVMTHLCCETTARSAFMRGFEVFFPVEGTATYNLAFHRASLINLAHGFAKVVLLKEISAALGG
jgi:bifunctional isochorismate lyase/aryl carrier protein